MRFFVLHEPGKPPSKEAMDRTEAIAERVQMFYEKATQGRMKIVPSKLEPVTPLPDLLAEAVLQGKPDAANGTLDLARGQTAADGPDGTPNHALELNGQDGMLRYRLPRFPVDNYSLSVRVRFNQIPVPHRGHVVSAWIGGYDAVSGR